MKNYLLGILLLLLIGCNQRTTDTSKRKIDDIATRYVKLCLEIGSYDADFVDAYYGPDSLKPAEGKDSLFPKIRFLDSITAIRKDLGSFIGEQEADSTRNRAKWLRTQCLAVEERIRIFSGETRNFDDESMHLFSVVAPKYEEAYFKKIISQLDSVLPGKGDINDRFQLLANRFIIPKDKLDTVFKVAITESRKRCLQFIPLPATEKFSLEYVTDKPWSGYNWYKGEFTSLIQLNTDTDIFIERIIDVASHESYPGHHVYNMLLEKKLYRDKGHVEISLYPLFSPQSFIAEGSANYGIALAFPGDEKVAFAKNVILPLAGLDTTGIQLYFDVLAVKGKLNFVRNEAARKLLSGEFDEKTATDWLIKYGMNNAETAAKSIRFIKKYRSYVINYNYGQELVKQYVERMAGSDLAKQWKVFEDLLSRQVLTSSLRQP